MENALKKIALLTSGGDAPGMNAIIRAVVREARLKKLDVVGVRRGYHGLITSDIFEMKTSHVNGIANKGGTILYSARSKEFTTPEGLQHAADNCNYMGIDGLVCIGGDGTFRGALELSETCGIAVCGIPATIDNDIACTNYTIGFDTAANTAIEAVDKLRDTMQSHERCSIVEVMGRHAGHLAVYVGLASGANAILVPEVKYDFDKDIVEKIRKARLHGRNHFIIVVSEGVELDGIATTGEIAEQVKEKTGLDPRITIIGHIQRGGIPTARDRVTGSRMGKYAVDILCQGKRNRVVGITDGLLRDFDISEALAMKKGLQEDMYETAIALTSA